MMAATRVLNMFDTFTSWDDLEDAVQRHIDSTFQPMVKASSKKVETHNKSCKAPYPTEMMYFYKSWQCSHRGTFRPKGKGIRRTKSQKEGCTARIQASLYKRDKSKIVVTILDERHNHEIGEHIYEKYVKNRCLEKDEIAHVDRLCSLNVSTMDVRKEMEILTGKKLTLQDIQNVKSSLKRKEKEYPFGAGDEPLNDVQLLYRKVEGRKKKDPGLVAEFGVLESGELQYAFIQTSQMKETLNKFPEHVLIDATNSLNDVSMPLISFIIVDGLNRSHLVAYAILATETSYMYDQILSVFKNANPSCFLTKTFMVDKDFVAIDVLQEHFPNSSCEFCLFHVKKTFKNKVFQCPKNVQAEMIECLDRMCAAESESLYEILRERLFTYNDSFNAYFITDWDSIREKWARYAMKEQVNFGDTINDQIELYHQKLKSLITSPLPLDAFFDKMFYYDTLLSELSQSEFLMKTKKSISLLPHLRKDITPYALRLVEEECKKSESWIVCKSGPASEGYLAIKGEEEVPVSMSNCSCSFFKTMFCLPCRHIICLCKHFKVQPLLNKDMFAARWHIYYNCSKVTKDEAGISMPYNWQSEPLFKTDRDRYTIVKTKLDSILKKVIEAGEDSFNFYLERLDEVDVYVSKLSKFSVNEIAENDHTYTVVVEGPIDEKISSMEFVAVDKMDEGP